MPMELEVRHLRALCAIDDTGSLHKAARLLGMTQPSLSTQLRRIEETLGGALFARERTGCRATPWAASSSTAPARSWTACAPSSRRPGRPAHSPRAAPICGSVPRRAGPYRAGCDGCGSASTRPAASRLLRMDVSANALLRLVGEGQLDVAFVHEVEGSPLRVPPGLRCRVLVEREPQYVSLAADHPAARRRVVRLADLADDRWMVDPTVDGEWHGLLRVLRAAGLNPRILHGDYLTAASLVATGEVVALCQPTSRGRPDMAIRPLDGDPIGVRLVLAARTEAELDAVYGDLEDAYWEAARQAPAYRERLPDAASA